MQMQLYSLGPTFTNWACHCLRTDRDFTDVIVETAKDLGFLKSYQLKNAFGRSSGSDIFLLP